MGAQDQVSAAYGGSIGLNLNAMERFKRERFLASPGRLEELEQHLSIFFTGFSRTAADIAKEQIRLTPKRERESSLMSQLVDDAESILTDSGRSLDELGRLLHESWQIKKSLTQCISNSSIDAIYEAGRSAGALGGKLLGAGGGGFMLFLTPPHLRNELRSRLKSLLWVPFCFSNWHSQVMVYEPEEVYDSSLARGEMKSTPSISDAIVLCGGAGLRLKSIMGQDPKVMACVNGSSIS